MGAGAPGAAAVSPLIGIAQRGGSVDVTLPDDTGELTAEDVEDLETLRLGDLETETLPTPWAGAIRPQPGASRVTEEGSIHSTEPQGVGQNVSDPSANVPPAAREGAPADQTEQNAIGAAAGPAVGVGAMGADKARTRSVPVKNAVAFSSIKAPHPLTGYLGNKKTMLDAGAYDGLIPRGASFQRIVEAFAGSGMLGNRLASGVKHQARTINDFDPLVTNFHQ